MTGFHLDWSISLGNIISLGVFLVTLLTLHKSNVRAIQEAAATMARMETKVTAIWEWWLRRQA